MNGKKGALVVVLAPLLLAVIPACEVKKEDKPKVQMHTILPRQPKETTDGRAFGFVGNRYKTVVGQVTFSDDYKNKGYILESGSGSTRFPVLRLRNGSDTISLEAGSKSDYVVSFKPNEKSLDRLSGWYKNGVIDGTIYLKVRGG